MSCGTFSMFIAMQPTIAVSMEAVTAACAARAVEIAIHAFILDNPAAHDRRWLLVRLFIYQAMVLLDDRIADPHVPDLTTDEGLSDFLFLRCFVIICVALDHTEFGLASEQSAPVIPYPLDARPAIASDQFRQISLAWEMVHQLDRYINAKYRFIPKADRLNKPKAFLLTTTVSPCLKCFLAVTIIFCSIMLRLWLVRSTITGKSSTKQPHRPTVPQSGFSHADWTAAWPEPSTPLMHVVFLTRT